jgi:hypothetical protein
MDRSAPWQDREGFGWVADARSRTLKVALEGRLTSVDTVAMRSTVLRLILFRLLPGRLVPLLTVFEVIQLVRRLRRRRPG